MYELDPKYLERLEILAGEIQESDELAQYLEEEEEDLYVRFKEMFEPRIGLIYEEVAADNPLQIIPLEQVLLDEAFEGLYLPRILGFSVLRGEIDEDVKYVRPQEHFKDVLLAICYSPNFDILKKRIGQSIQIGFALSSDIWVTNLINSIDNKRIRYYLQSQKLERYRREQERLTGYRRYKRQFSGENFQTAEFPEDAGSLKVLFSPLKHFLIHRINIDKDNSSIIPELKAFVENEAFQGAREYMEIAGLYGMFFDISDEDAAHLAEHFNKVRRETPEFDEQFLEFILELHQRDDLDLTPAADLRMAALLDPDINDELKHYYALIETVHQKGYTSEEAQEACRVFYTRYPGLSTVNECLRKTILRYFAVYINNLEEENYADLFEISKLFPIYMSIFANQQFNQHLKDLSMAYVHRLLKRYTDKRGKDYQDIKKFVSTTFQDLGFLQEKEVVELFKTRRKKKKKAATE